MGSVLETSLMVWGSILPMSTSDPLRPVASKKPSPKHADPQKNIASKVLNVEGFAVWGFKSSRFNSFGFQD